MNILARASHILHMTRERQWNLHIIYSSVIIGKHQRQLHKIRLNYFIIVAS